MKSENYSLEATLSGHTEKVWSLSWSPTSPSLSSTGTDKTIRTWTLADKWMETGRVDDAHSRTVRGVSYSPSGSRIASCSFDSTTTIWEKTSSGGYYIIDLYKL